MATLIKVNPYKSEKDPNGHSIQKVIFYNFFVDNILPGPRNYQFKILGVKFDVEIDIIFIDVLTFSSYNYGIPTVLTYTLCCKNHHKLLKFF